jgi:hypothetical protein
VAMVLNVEQDVVTALPAAEDVVDPIEFDV